MHPGSITTLYRLRRVGLILACLAPVLLAGGVYLIVTQVLLVPAVPDAATPPDRLLRFIVHEKGLPRLRGEKCETFLQQQIQRLVRDEGLRNRFLAEYRTANPEEQKAFREHLFDAIKPIVMRDIHAYQAMPEAGRPAYLDERIVTYNRMNAFWGDVRISKNDLGPGQPGPDELLGMLTQKTTEAERQSGVAYGAALHARVLQILADPALKAEFEARITGRP